MFTFIAIVVAIVLYVSLSSRVTELERRLGIRRGHGPLPKSQAQTAQAVPQPQVQPVQPVVVREEPIITPQQALRDVMAPSESAAAAPESVPTPRVKDASDSLEFKFGSKIFTALGALAVVIGVAFFLTFAFQSGLINESARIILGIIAGIALSGLGYWLSKKYATYGQTLIGTGLGLLYLSIYSSYNFYHFISNGAAFFFMLIVTAIGVALALATNSLTLASFAGLGGFLTPFLISGAAGDALPLFSYVLALDVGIVVIAFYKLWRPLVFGSFVGTVLVVLSWLSQSYRSDMWVQAEFIIVVFFALFLVVSLVHFWRQRAPEDEYDLGLVIANPLSFYLISYAVINPIHHEIMGIFTVLMGIVYVALWLVIRKETDRDIRFRSFLAGVGFVLFVIAVPIQFEKFVITIAWALEALVLMYFGTSLRSRALKIGSQLLFGLVFLRLLLLDSQLAVEVPFLNTRFIAIAMSLIAFVIAYALLYRSSDSKEEDKTSLGLMMAEMALIFVVGFSVDVSQFFDATALTFFWIIAVAVLAVAGFAVENIVARIFSFCLLFITIFRFLFVHASLGDNAIPFVNIRFGLLLLTILVSGLFSIMYRRSSLGSERTSGRNILLIEMYILAQLLFTLEINDFFSSHWLTFAWSLVAIAAFALGLFVKNQYLRIAVYVTFVITTLKALFSDIVINSSDYAVIFNVRVLAFLSVIASLFAVTYLLYARKENATQEEVKGLVPWLVIGANVLLLILMSTEVIDFFDRQMLTETYEEVATLESIKRVVLSVVWIIYAAILLGVGIVKASSKARIMAIVLLAITILKVFLYDTAQLDNFYRFISWISLGAILLLTGFLYNKYKERIQQFIAADAQQ